MKKHFFENKDAEQSSDLFGAKNISDAPENDEEASKAETLLTKSEIKPRKKRRFGMVKAQKIMIVSFACVAVVMSVLYFAWLKPLKDKLSEEKPTEPPTLLAGEAYSDDGNRILMFPHIANKDIVSVEVHNSYETFSCVQSKENKENYSIKEHPLAPISTSALASFLVDAGYTVVDRRITENPEEFALYGLSEEDNPAYYILTDSSGEDYKVYIGNEIVAGGSYYARYEGRDVVYLLSSSSIASTLLSPSTALISPLLGYPMDQTSVTMLSDMVLNKNGQPFVSIKYTDTSSGDEYDGYTISAYEMLYPGSYVVNDDNYSLIMLASLSQLEGYAVLEAGGAGKKLIDDEAIMAEYGFFDIKNPPYELYYYMEGIMPTLIAFAPSGIDGYYFAYAYIYDIIVLVETETVEYLDWDLIEFITPSLFTEHIADVSEMTVSGNLRYDGKNYSIDERFSISYDEDEGTLNCYAYSSGKLITGTTPEVNYVQGLYGTALRLQLGGYIKTEDTDIEELVSNGEYASMTIKMKNGEVLEYKFYKYTGGRCYYTVNGEGEFWILLSSVNKLLIDSVRASHEEYVNSDLEYPQLPEDFINANN